MHTHDKRNLDHKADLQVPFIKDHNPDWWLLEMTRTSSIKVEFTQKLT